MTDDCYDKYEVYTCLIFTRFSTAFGHKNDSYPLEYKKGYNTGDDLWGQNQIGPPLVSRWNKRLEEK